MEPPSDYWDRDRLDVQRDYLLNFCEVTRAYLRGVLHPEYGTAGFWQCYLITFFFTFITSAYNFVDELLDLVEFVRDNTRNVAVADEGTQVGEPACLPVVAVTQHIPLPQPRRINLRLEPQPASDEEQYVPFQNGSSIPPVLNILCFNCRKFGGHISSECPNPKAPRSSRKRRRPQPHGVDGST
ncbi:unnamed protein product [Orchesella dallaii]|uniref:CCHC-type domain-containing protein n=1 Tax=Orchesella dallaii TaxID=48710 RepID=A0ABP1S102_9HEXA